MKRKTMERIIGVLAAVLLAGCADLFSSGSNTDNTSNNKPLSAPGSLAAVSLGETSIRLTWNTVSGAVRYNVYRSASASGAYTKLGNSTQERTYTDTGLLAGTPYYYRVCGLRYSYTDDEGNYASVSVSTDAAGMNPANLKMSSGSAASITLAWTEAANAESYRILRAATDKDPFTQIGTSPSNSYTDTAVEADKSYFYKVIGIKPGGQETNESNTAFAFAASFWNLPTHTAKQAMNMPTGAVHYYRIAVTAGTSYTVEWQDEASHDGTTVTSRINYCRVSAWQNDGTSIFSNANTGYTNPRTFTASSTGYVTVQVVPNGSASGNYAIYYFDNGTVNTGDGSGALPPSSPGGVKVTTPSAGGIILSWNSVSGADNYQVFRANTATAAYSLIGTAGGLSYTDSTTTNGTSYYYKVSAISSGGKSPQSAAAFAFATGYNEMPYFSSKQAVYMPSEAKHYYRIEVTSGTSYTIEWQDEASHDGTTVTSRISYCRVSAWQNDGTSIFSNANTGYTNPRTFTASSAGYVTVQVVPNGSASGNYAIYYFQN
jgi:fibronectin type 3 domain-containing protein